VTYATFVETVPVFVRLLLAVVVTTGISLAFAVPLRRRAVLLDSIGRRPEGAYAGDADGPPADPNQEMLVGRVLGFITTAFVFLLAFTLSQFWSNAQDARTATQDETAAYIKSLTAADRLSDSAIGDQLVASIQAYRAAVIDQEWPLMQQADQRDALTTHQSGSVALAQALADAANAGAATDLAYQDVRAGIETMISEGNTRIAQMPSPDAPGVLFVIFILGISSLALTAIFLPTRARPYLLLVSITAVITALMFFLLLEATNPFIGSGAVPVPTVIEP